MSWTQEDRNRLTAVARETHYGYGDGHRDVLVRTQHETVEWRGLAKEHEAARYRLNALLPPAPYMRRRYAGATFLGDHADFSGPAVQAALSDYHRVCASALGAPGPRPRRILTMIRLAAELAGAPDPVWSAGEWGCPMSGADFAFNKLFRQTERALKTAGLD